MGLLIAAGTAQSERDGKTAEGRESLRNNSKQEGPPMSVEIGQTLEIDLCGLRLGSRWLNSVGAGKVVAVGPGVITVLMNLEGRGPREVTVSSGRVRRRLDAR